MSLSRWFPILNSQWLPMLNCCIRKGIQTFFAIIEFGEAMPFEAWRNGAHPQPGEPFGGS